MMNYHYQNKNGREKNNHDGKFSAFFAYSSAEDHFKYRQAVMEAYPQGHYPVFEGFDHMQYQIRDPKGFAEMLTSIVEQDCMPPLPFVRA